MGAALATVLARPLGYGAYQADSSAACIVRHLPDGRVNHLNVLRREVPLVVWARHGLDFPVVGEDRLQVLRDANLLR